MQRLDRLMKRKHPIDLSNSPWLLCGSAFAGLGFQQKKRTLTRRKRGKKEKKLVRTAGDSGLQAFAPFLHRKNREKRLRARESQGTWNPFQNCHLPGPALYSQPSPTWAHFNLTNWWRHPNRVSKSSLIFGLTLIKCAISLSHRTKISWNKISLCIWNWMRVLEVSIKTNLDLKKKTS